MLGADLTEEHCEHKMATDLKYREAMTANANVDRRIDKMLHDRPK